MTTPLPFRQWAAGGALALAGLLAGTTAQAQALNYAVAGAANVAGTYTDLGTAGTAISTANNDDDNSAAQNIGFTFGYNGATFTQFVLSTNGFIKLGATAPSAANLFLCNVAGCTTVSPVTSTDPADVNLVMPFNFDLEPGTGVAEYRVATTGTAPNRVCTVQWKNVRDKPDATPANTQYSNFSFQARLYEGSNNIEFVYGTATASAATAVSRFPIVGIKGSGAAAGQTVLGSKTTGAAAWTATTFITGNYTGSTHNFRNAAPPDAGRTYRFAPTVLANNDAAVTVVYTLGKVASAYGSPHVVQAVVGNPGTVALTNKVVTLTVSGATTFTNSQTIATLAPGASTTVTFTGYPVVGTTGTNTVTVSVPADDVAANNSQVATQLVTAGEMSYIQGSTYVGGAGIAAADAVLAVRYTAATAGALNVVTTNFNGAVAAATYQVVVYNASGAGGTPGTALYTSPTRPRPAAGGDDVVTIPSIAIPAGNFFVGIKAITATNLAVSYQTEVPLRPGVFVYTTTNGTTWVDVNTTTLNSRLAVNVALGVPLTCPPPTNLLATAVNSTGATLTFAPGSAATGYTVRVTPAGGATVTSTTTASPVALTGLTPGTVYTATVTANCPAGETSTAATVTFTTTTPPGNTVSFGGVCGLALPIPDNAGGVPGSVSYPITVSGVTGTLQAVDFIITHTFDGDLIMSLTSPAGQTVVLSQRRGGSGDNFGNAANCPTDVTSLADANTATLVSGAAPFIGPFAPDNPLTGFSGTPNGTWTFTVTDNAGADVGTLDYVKLTFSAPATCAPVTALTAGSLTPTSAALTFTAGAGATGYTVRVTPAGGTAVTSTAPASPVALSGLTPGTTYTATVTKNCAAGLNSTAVSVTFTTPFPPCPAVTGLSAGSLTPTSAALTFTAAATATGYTVRVTPAGGATVTSTATASPVALSGLTPGTTYTATVTTNCASAQTSAAVAVTFTTPFPPCPAITGLSAGNVGQNTATLSFTPAAGATGYTVVVSAPGVAPVTSTATGSPVNLTGLNPGTAYTATVTTNCASAQTSAGVSVTFTTLFSPCPGVTGLSAGSITTTSATLTFTPAATATGYTVRVTPAGGATVVSTTTGSPVSLTGLMPGTAYTATITTNCASAQNSGAVSVSFTTPFPPCPAITGLAAGGITPTTANLTFTPAASAVGYTIALTPAGGTTVTSTATGSPVALTGLAPGTAYTATVTTNCASAQTSGAVSVSFTTPFPVCPAVTGLAVPAATLTPTSASLSFTPAATGLTYTVTYTAQGGTPQTVTPAAGGSPVSLTGLIPGTAYTATVVTNCASVQTSAAVSVTFTTPFPPCPAVTGLAAGSLTPTSASLTFAPATGAIGYTITLTPAGGPPVTSTATTSPVALTGLTPGTAYTATVTTNCASAQTSGAVSVTFTTPFPPCLAASNLVVGSFTATNASLSFTPAAGALSYTVLVSAPGITPVPITATGSPVALTGLNPGTVYSVSLTTTCAAGQTSAPVTTTFTAPAPAPTNGTAGNITETTADLGFDPAAGATSYTVTYTPQGGTATTVTVTSAPVVLTGLTALTTYTVTVVANYPGGAASAPLTFTFTTLRGTAVRGTLAGTAVQLFPNPAQRSTTLVLPALGTARTARLVLVNALGQTVRTQVLALTPGGTRALVDLTGLATGRYTARIQAGPEGAALPLVVE